MFQLSIKIIKLIEIFSTWPFIKISNVLFKFEKCVNLQHKPELKIYSFCEFLIYGGSKHLKIL